MNKIFSLARNLIFAIMADLTANCGFTVKEVAWKAVLVEEQLVVFEVHQKIKDLLEEELIKNKAEAKKISFRLKGDSIWEAEVQANGSESYFFSRLLFMALARLKSGVIDVQSVNCDIIERHTSAAAMKVIGNSMGLVVKAKRAKGKYSIVVPVNGITITFSDKNVDSLCRWIGLQLRGCISTKKQRRKI